MTGIVASSPDGSIEIAALATVLASGDYAANVDLKASYVSEAVSKVDAMNPTATGDGHVMAFPLGAKVLNGHVLSGPNLRFAPPPKETMDRRLPCSHIITKIMKVGLG